MEAYEGDLGKLAELNSCAWSSRYNGDGIEMCAA